MSVPLAESSISEAGPPDTLDTLDNGPSQSLNDAKNGSSYNQHLMSSKKVSLSGNGHISLNGNGRIENGTAGPSRHPLPATRPIPELNAMMHEGSSVGKAEFVRLAVQALRDAGYELVAQDFPYIISV